jgi:hypothetical protein
MRSKQVKNINHSVSRSKAFIQLAKYDMTKDIQERSSISFVYQSSQSI